MGSMFRKPTCERCGRDVVFMQNGRGRRPCVCQPRPKLPGKDRLTEKERVDVECIRRAVAPVQGGAIVGVLLDIVDRLAPKEKKQ